MIIEKQIKITKINVTAQEWQLYTASMGCSGAARALNSAFKKAVNAKGSTPESVQEEMDKVRAVYSKYGAYDTEPRYTMYDLIKKVYGRYPEGVF